ncbi:putative Gonadotropin-releasing hormone receptor [Hypsibius exemplaris]|uniref:Gonadotropin-releasing hormone receptor n=1 Tax=Hypsibius exemplaris TaxID=2072580 RepID=A0A1W0WXB3_HYPEX|nr:putative Gonadotropin-releasing hormone receptor [Hypsibius exemplaris]
MEDLSLRLENGSALDALMKLLANSNMTDFRGEDLHTVYEDLVNVYNNGTILTFIVLILGLGANVALLWSLLTNTDRKSRLRPFLINLAVADLMVCCFTIAMELGWRLTVTWTAGDFFCRFLSFTKTLGLYLEAFVVLAMSIDRCYVVLWPLRITGQLQRMRIFLIVAWLAAIVFSIPQAVVFHVELHPDHPEFAQCVTMNSFSSPATERGYVIFGILAMYVVPLIVIVIVSLILLYTIRSPPNHQKCRISGTTMDSLKLEFVHSEPLKVDQLLTPCRGTDISLSGMVGLPPNSPPAHSPVAVTRSDTVSDRMGSFGSFGSFTGRPMRMRLHTGLQLCHTDTIIRKRARSRTLKLSMLIVLAFVLCYTPYAIMITIAFMDTQEHPDEFMIQLTEALLMLSLSFSTIMNPVVYGSYMIHTRKCWRNILQCRRRTFSNDV